MDLDTFQNIFEIDK